MTDVEALLTKHGIDYRPSGANLTAFCMNCGHTRERTWSVHRDTGTFICNRPNSCGWRGSFRDLQAYLGEQPIGRPRLANPAPKVITYKDADSSKLKSTSTGHLAWFDKRGIKRETVEAYGIKENAGAIAFPVYDHSGKLVNIKFRAMDAKKFWNEAGTLRLPFGIQNVEPSSKALLIVEGEIDALSAYQYGVRSVISLPNGTQDQEWIEPLWDWLDRFTEIWLSTDMDAAGQDARRLLVERLGSWRCRGVDLPHKDLNECLMNGVSAENILDLLNKASDFKPEKLRNASEFTETVIDAFQNKQALLGDPTGLDGLDRLIRGWRGGELTIWTGQNGSGKSTVLGQVALNLVDQGKRVCVASLELSPQRYLRWLVGQLANHPDPDEGLIRLTMETIGSGMWFVDHVGSIKTDLLLDTFEYAARRYAVRHFVVDSLVKLGIRSEDYEGQRQATSDLCDFADRFDCHVHLVAHPRKQDSDNVKPGKMDVKGAGEITDLADNVLSIYRNKQPKPGQVATILTVLKNREHGLEGDVPLHVDPKTKRVTCDVVQTGGENERKRPV